MTPTEIEPTATGPTEKDIQKNEPTEYRPWGSFTVIGDFPDCKTKRLDVLPGKRLSLQSHRFRTEYWVVVCGTAKVTLNHKTLTLNPGQTLTIPVGARHRIENPGTTMLSIIEVQLGSYFGEDDITRYHDDFDRI